MHTVQKTPNNANATNSDPSLTPEMAAEKYKKEQRERLSRKRIGESDDVGHVITKIFSRGDEYIIYEIAGVSEAESFRVLIDTEIESDPQRLIDRFENIKEDLVNFRSILFKGVHDKSIKLQAANAISTALRGDIPKSKQMFEKIAERVTKEYDIIQKGRILYLSGAFALAVIFVIVAVVFYIYRGDEWVKAIPEIKYMAYASAFSGFGGILSVCTNIQKVEFERDSAMYTYSIYGLQRVLISSLCGALAYALIKGDLIFSFILKTDNPTLGIMVVCAVAGFSETLIPNALKKIESQEG
ncbi:hypothetical protein [Methylobacter sp.]|uniref:hypothetical protein n=1 Tax=Methylobacter sp. TaxID=2051955 RepID=UPI00248A2B90|nr:hypothetical protein [Methylobacter sp.]MDI1277624.1 hypothetical protein [Methylobacter sp.]MDI1358232.1 hypothetical protein [Methylobacter sp.]